MMTRPADIRCHGWIMTAILMAALPACPAGADVVRLKIVDAPATTSTFVVRGGMPLPQGAVKWEKQAGVRIVGGKPVPIQTEPLALWPDKSCKWLLVTFYARQGREYEFYYGGDNVEQPEVESLEVSKNDRGVVVDTGPLEFSILKRGGALMDDVRLNGSPIVKKGGAPRRNFVDYLHVEQPERYGAGAWPVAGVADRSSLAVEQIKVERSGPIEAVICIIGRHYYDRVGRAVSLRGELFNDAGSEFTVRVHAYVGSPVVRIVHTFTYEGCPRYDFLHGAGLALPVELTGENRFVTFGTPSGSRQLAGHSGSARLLQSTDGSFSIARQSSEDTTEAVKHAGRHSLGWIDLSDGRRGVAIAIQDIWKNYPKALEADMETGTLTAWLYPPQVSPLDLRRYSYEYSVGEIHGRFGMGSACGLQKTHEVAICFHTGAPGPGIAEMLEPATRPPLLVATPQCYARTKVSGTFAAEQIEDFPELERAYSSTADFYLWAQDHYRWYGLIDYGDFQAARGGEAVGPGYRLDANDDKWHSDKGGLGWNNGGGLTARWLLTAFMRTGDAQYYHAGRAMVQHVQDIDTIHTDYYIAGAPSARRVPEEGSVRGAAHRGGVNHWSDGYTGSAISNPAALRIAYFLTGDSRFRDGLSEVFEHNIGRRLGRWHSETTASALYSLLTEWEINPNDRYKRLLNTVARSYTDYIEKVGKFPAAVPYRFDTRHWAKEPYGEAGGADFHSSGCLAALIAIAELLDDDALADAIVAQVDAELPDAAFPTHLRALGYAYRRTGAEKYRDKLAELLGELHTRSREIVEHDDQDADYRQTRLPFPETTLNSAWLNAIPYVIDDLKSRGDDESDLDLE